MDLTQMQDLISWLNDRTYEYDIGNPTVSDNEWDSVYFTLVDLERKSGITLPNSPTQKISYEVKNALTKVQHSHKMLSLDKTKDENDVISFIGNQNCIIMSKMDGLTCSLTYENTYLISAETRGNGLIGEDVLHNAKVITNIPKRINYTGRLIIDGEIIITKTNFQPFSLDYKNPRNFAAGSIRLLDSEECFKRHLSFIAWDVIEGLDDCVNLSDKLTYIKNLGFEIVPFIHSIGLSKVLFDNSKSELTQLSDKLGYPIDGLVFKFNDIAYSKSLGSTEHHFKNAIAFKFFDESYPTNLVNIEWTMGRTGVLTPIAVFDNIDIDGSSVSRASLHNVSIMNMISNNSQSIGDIVYVYKANMIIPQISKWENVGNKQLEIPTICPYCGSPVVLKDNDGIQLLVCINSNCDGRLINRLDHFCGKKGLDIKGLSKSTLEKLLDWGWIGDISDIFNLATYKNEWIQKPGFGVKSVEKILEAIENSKTTTLTKFIAAIGIPLIGLKAAAEIERHIKTWEDFRKKVDNKFDFSIYDDFGFNKSEAILKFNYNQADKIYPLLTFQNNSQEITTNTLQDVKVVITGKLAVYPNRNALKNVIEQNGGKVVDAVSKNTTYLINNDINSTSAKNNSAKKLGIPILTEQEFISKFNLK